MMLRKDAYEKIYSKKTLFQASVQSGLEESDVRFKIIDRQWIT